MALWVKYNNCRMFIQIHTKPISTLHLSLVNNRFTENPPTHKVTVINLRTDKHALTWPVSLHIRALVNGRSRPAQCRLFSPRQITCETMVGCSCYAPVVSITDGTISSSSSSSNNGTRDQENKQIKHLPKYKRKQTKIGILSCGASNKLAYEGTF